MGFNSMCRRWMRRKIKLRLSIAARSGDEGVCGKDIFPRQYFDACEAFENAIASAVAASGGSTNAVLHLLAIAREAGS